MVYWWSIDGYSIGNGGGSWWLILFDDDLC